MNGGTVQCKRDMTDLAESVVTFDPVTLARLRHRRFQPSTSPLHLQLQPGQHRSFHPGGFDAFVSHQPYTGGDDLRRIDWQVAARTGRLFTRQYENHVQQQFWLALDISASMTFTELPPWLRGRQSLMQSSANDPATHTNHPLSKLAFCQCMSLALSQIIIWQHDQLGCALLADSLLGILTPSCTRAHWQALYECMHKLQPKPATRLTTALTQLFHRTPQPGVLVLMSDFLCEDLASLWPILHQYQRAGWSLVIVHVLAPDELSFPGNQPVQWVDMETGNTLRGTPAQLRHDYQQRMTELQQTIQRETWALGATYHHWNTGNAWLLEVENMLTTEAR